MKVIDFYSCLYIVKNTEYALITLTIFVINASARTLRIKSTLFSFTLANEQNNKKDSVIVDSKSATIFEKIFIVIKDEENQEKSGFVKISNKSTNND